MPNIEELLTKLNGGERFSKLDLSQAYQQVELEEESQAYVAINTQCGLFAPSLVPTKRSSTETTLIPYPPLQGFPYGSLVIPHFLTDLEKD